MNEKKKRITVSLDIDLLFTIYQTVKPNQTLDDRVVELLEKGINARQKGDPP